MNAQTNTPFDQHPAPQQAGIMCNDPIFQKFAAVRCGFPDQQFGQIASAEYLRLQCEIRSRRELANNAKAQSKFHALKTEFDAWRGRIAPQR